MNRRDSEPERRTTPERRPKFSTLFTDARHYRGDCRLLRTAVRGGWLRDAPQAERTALVDRLRKAMNERRDDPDAADGTRARASLAAIEAIAEMARDDLRPLAIPLRYVWAGELTDRTTGRPRERRHVSEMAQRIDANEIRRRAKADGTDLRTMYAIDVRPADKPDHASERIALAVVADKRYGWRLWLVCPGCTRRLLHLYPTRAGGRCRKCAGIGYGDLQ